MTERISLGRLKPEIQQQLKGVVYDPSIGDNTDISPNCFIFKKNDLSLAQETAKDLQFLVNAIDGTPNQTSIFGQLYGDNNEWIFVFWRARVSESAKLAIDIINRDRLQSGKPALPPLKNYET